MMQAWPRLEDVAAITSVPHTVSIAQADAGRLRGMTWQEVPTPHGTFLVGATAHGAASLCFPTGDNFEDELAIFARMERLGLGFSQTGRRRAFEAGLELMGYFAGEVTDFSLPYDQRFLSDFQRDVLRVLREVPFGETITPAELARAAGHPTKVGPVLLVLRHNPLPIFVPCHRVRPERGGLGAYCVGQPWKRCLLEHEGARR